MRRLSRRRFRRPTIQKSYGCTHVTAIDICDTADLNPRTGRASRSAADGCVARLHVLYCVGIVARSGFTGLGVAGAAAARDINAWPMFLLR